MLHPQTFSQAFKRLIERTEVPKIRLHDLRHTHATIALVAGVSPKIISGRLGHESPAFTLKQYAHAIPGMQAAAALQIASLVGCELNPLTDQGTLLSRSPVRGEGQCRSIEQAR